MADAAPTSTAPPSVEEWTARKRFIRTLESDSAAIKGGAQPALMQPPEKQAVAPAPVDPLSEALLKTAPNSLDLDAASLDPALLGKIPENPIRYGWP